MPKSTTCKYLGKTITAEDALKLSKIDRQGLTCLECERLVTPHRASKPGKNQQAAHFEHAPSAGGRNASCSLSDPVRT